MPRDVTCCALPFRSVAIGHGTTFPAFALLLAVLYLWMVSLPCSPTIAVSPSSACNWFQLDKNTKIYCCHAPPAGSLTFLAVSSYCRTCSQRFPLRCAYASFITVLLSQLHTPYYNLIHHHMNGTDGTDTPAARTERGTLLWPPLAPDARCNARFRDTLPGLLVLNTYTPAVAPYWLVGSLLPLVQHPNLTCPACRFPLPHAAATFLWLLHHHNALFFPPNLRIA